MKTLIFILSTLLLLAATGCSSGKAGLKVSGAYKSETHGHYNDLCKRMGWNPKEIGKGKKISVIEVDPTGHERQGPYRCGGMQGDQFNGCWLGINYSGDTIYLPRGFQPWVLRHEVYHSVLRHMMSKGIDCVVVSSARTPGHYMLVKIASGQVVDVQTIVETRWPAEWKENTLAFLPGGITPQQALKKKPTGMWDILCVVPEGPEYLVK